MLRQPGLLGDRHKLPVIVGNYAVSLLALSIDTFIIPNNAVDAIAIAIAINGMKDATTVLEL